MAKKKYDPNDFTNQEQAMNKENVDQQDAKTRLWQSMNYSYGKQRDESDKAYDRNISQQDNAALARGMGRSSYAEQIRASLLNDKAKAQNDSYAAQIADYQNRIGQIEQQELENQRYEQQYADQRADTAWSQNMQTQQFEYQKQQAAEQMAYQKERDAIADAYNERAWQAQQDQWKQEFDYNSKSNEQKMAFDIVTAALAAGNDADDATLARAGITRAEYNSMKKKASSGKKGTTPDWKKLGYPSKEAYEAALAAAKQTPSDADVEQEARMRISGALPNYAPKASITDVAQTALGKNEKEEKKTSGKDYIKR